MMTDTAAPAQVYTFEGEESLTASIAKLDKINARAEKRGLDARYSYTVETTERDVELLNGVTVRRVEYVLTVTGSAPRIAGWVFVATLVDDPAVGITTRVHPDYDGPVIDRDAVRPGECDHCHTRRARRNTYLVENTETGERLQVGASCVRDFLGQSFSPSWIDDTLDDTFATHPGIYVAPRWNTLDVLTLAVAASRVYGFVSTRGPGMSTRERVAVTLDPRSPADRETAHELTGAVTDRDTAHAQVVAAWVASQPEESNYMSNLRAILAADSVTYSHLGVLVSAPAAYTRATEEVVVKAAAPVSQWIGAVGEKITVTVSVSSIRYIEGFYGTTTLYTLTTPEGHVLKWFASSEQGWDEGDVLTLRATVKKHDEYDGVRQTVVTRAKEIAA